MTRDERVMLDAYRGFSEVIETGAATVLLIPEARDSPMVNRAVGLGIDAPATEADVDAVLDAFPPGTSFYVALAPRARPEELPSWLADRGLEPGWGWMAFRRGLDVPEAPPTQLSLVAVDSNERAAAFARVVRLGYGLPDRVEGRLARVPSLGWECLLALDGDELAGAAATFVAEGAAYLGFAATLPEHRGKGAQTALLAERIRRAAEAGCDAVLTETGERRDELPSNSYRNILRAGFTEVEVTQNWVGTHR